MTAASQPWKGAGGGSAVTRYEYDVQDHLVKVADGEGNVTRYAYSDRDLMSRQVSEVSGTTEYRYNEHGALVLETDSRGITVLHTIDALDRRIFSDYPDDALDTRFTWDDPLVPFSKRRLTAIIRNGATVAYRYDSFGRVIQDGALTYSYDANGNRQEIGYPGDVTATYTFDFADRQERLVLTEPGLGPKTIASDAKYLASGPLASVVLGNGVVATRTFDERYFPTGIQVPGKLGWQYTTDGLGNVLSIHDALNPSQPRSYAYQDVAYFLTQGNGPWGNLGWTYDKIGNRLTQTRGGVTETYSYIRNASGGNNPQLAAVATAAPAPAKSYYYDAAGNQTYRAAGEEKVRFGYNAERQLSQIARDTPADPPAQTRITYDGRGFLQTATLSPVTGADIQVRTWATYASGGVLLHKFSESWPSSRDDREEAIRDADSFVLYFAGRFVALLEKASIVTPGAPQAESRRLLYITSDHLGTPVLLMDESANSVWAGGFSPFGEDFAQAREAGLFLRFPGQWEDPAWLAGGLYYNLHRWHDASTGRYTRPDPLGLRGDRHPFAYARLNPLRFVDSSGLQSDIPPPPPSDRDPFVPRIDPRFPSGPWGRRPDPKCCDPQKIRDGIASVDKQLSTMGSGGEPSGTIGGSVIRGHFCRDDGWCKPEAPSRTNSFQPFISPDIKDKCVVFCIRIHEWYHYTDTRWWHLRWEDAPLTRFWEEPAYQFERACLLSFSP